MNVPSQLITEADAVRQSIAADEKAGSIALAEFARQHARTSAHKNAALAINASVSGIDDPVILEALRDRMMEVLDRIVEDAARDGEDETNLQARKLLFAKLRKSPSEKAVVCRITDLEKSYAGSDFVLGPATFEFLAGEITALIGENAHGKTTLLRTLVGELRRSAGHIEFPALVNGSRVRWAMLRQSIGYLPQKLPDWRGPLSDTLYFHAALRGLRPGEADTQVQYVIARLGLSEFMQRSWSQLSGGTQLKFALASALVGRPRLLLLDEPLANLDPKKQASVLWDIRQLARSVHNPMTVLISSQVLNPLEAISDNVIFLHNGRVQFAGPRDAIGAARTHNVYECDSRLSLSELQERIGERVHSISHTGVLYIIKTPLDVSYRDILQILQDANVAFTSIRDIGRSAISLFESD